MPAKLARHIFALIFTAIIVCSNVLPAAAGAGDGPAPQTVYAWTKTWGGGSAEAGATVEDGAGNLFVAGQFSGSVNFNPDPLGTPAVRHSFNGTIDAFVSKFDANGNFLWVKTWGGKDRDVAYGVGVDAAGNAYVTGPFRYTVNFNPNLNPDASATRTSSYNGENNIYVSKFAPDGAFQWVRTWGPSGPLAKPYLSFGGEAYTVLVRGNYLYLVGDYSGLTTDFNPWGNHDYHTNHMPPADWTLQIVFFDAWLAKLDLNGNFLWAKTWGGEGYDDGPGVAVDSQGNIYVAGMYASTTINFDPAGSAKGLGHPAHDSGSLVDVFLSKFDANGNFQWVRTWGGQGTDEAMGSVAVDGDDNVYVAGRYGCNPACNFNNGPTAQTAPDMRQSNGDLDVFLTKYTSAGDYGWTRTWGGAGLDQAFNLAVDPAGSLYVGGRYSGTVNFNTNPGGVDQHTSAGGYDAFVSQFDLDGNFQGARTFGSSAGDEAASVYVSPQGAVYLTGSFAGTVAFDPSAGSVTAQGGTGNAFVTKLAPQSPLPPMPYAVFLPAVLR